MRYQFYREHKYVSFVLNDLERLIAKTDFRKPAEVLRVQRELQDVIDLLKSHAEYEDTKLHVLLRKKGSKVFQEAEGDHQHQHEQFEALQSLLNKITASSDQEILIELGYQFYLTYRKFVGDNLAHLHEEETVILPELQRLYSDEELAEVEHETYQQMAPEHLIDMMQILFPHMNPTDKEAFLKDIQNAVPEKYQIALAGMQKNLTLDIGGIQVRTILQTPHFEMFEFSTEKENLGPGLHFHREMTEMFYPIEGKVAITIQDKVHIAGPSDFMAVTPLTIHQWKSCGPLKMLALFSPSKNQAEYFAGLFKLSREGKNLADSIAALAEKYDNIPS